MWKVAGDGFLGGAGANVLHEANFAMRMKFQDDYSPPRNSLGDATVQRVGVKDKAASGRSSHGSYLKVAGDVIRRKF